MARDYASKDLLLDVVGPVDRRRRLRQVLACPEEPVQRRRRQADLRADQLLLVGRVLPEVDVRQVGRHRARRPGTSSWRCATRSRARAIHPDRHRHRRHPWVASAWFDYLNIRINGAPFHRDLLAGKHRFDDPRCKKVFDTLARGAAVLRPQGQVLLLPGGRRPRCWAARRPACS